MVGSFFQCFPAGGGTSQTGVNARAGARTQASELITVAMVVATLLFLSPLISLLPNATLAAVVVVTTLPLLGTTEFRAILRVRRTEFLWALASCAGVVLLGTLQGILVAVAISVLTLTCQANDPLVYVVRRKPGTEVFRPQSSDHPGDETEHGISLWLCTLNPPALEVVRCSPLGRTLGSERMFLNLREAVQAYESQKCVKNAKVTSTLHTF